jgi:hypothetical protein
MLPKFLVVNQEDISRALFSSGCYSQSALNLHIMPVATTFYEMMAKPSFNKGKRKVPSAAKACIKKVIRFLICSGKQVYLINGISLKY